MKPYYLALILFISCSKEETIEKPKIEPISMTQTRKMYNVKGQYEGTLNIIHFHRVSDPELIAQYKAIPAFQPFCDDLNDTLVTVVAKPDNCEIK